MIDEVQLFSKCILYVQVLLIKVIRNKVIGLPEAYNFLELAYIQQNGKSSILNCSFVYIHFSYLHSISYFRFMLAILSLEPVITEDELRKLFVQFGDIVYTKILVAKGCGFVQFTARLIRT